MELFEQMRREYEHGVGTIKGVARKFGVHRRMVREAIGNAVPAARKIPDRDRPKLGSSDSFHRGDAGSGPEGAAKTAAHGASDLVSAASGASGNRDSRINSAAVRAGAQGGNGVGTGGSVRAAKLVFAPDHKIAGLAVVGPAFSTQGERVQGISCRRGSVCPRHAGRMPEIVKHLLKNLAAVDLG